MQACDEELHTVVSHLAVYGQDHSPWVQAVLPGLHEKNIPYALTTVPPVSVFWKSGVMIPAVSIDGTPWILDSADILQRVGYEEGEQGVKIRQGLFTVKEQFNLVVKIGHVILQPIG